MTKSSADSKLDLSSPAINEEKITELRQLLPEVFSEDRIDFERLRLLLGDAIDNSPERYGLSWAGKSEAFQSLRIPATGTLLPCPDESVNFDNTENLIIEGDNLEVLKLLQKSYSGKVKMIYIDPPYNTGNDFIYPDNFRDSLNNYLRYSGQIDEQGNATTSDQNRSGRLHSNWLNMMYPRLYLARNLLRDDGVIFVSIDDNEVHNLRTLMNEIFGEENFIANIIWQKKYTRSNDAKWFSDNHDHILVFSSQSNLAKINNLARNENQTAAYSNPDGHKKGVWKATPLHAKSGTSRETYIFKNGVAWTPPAGTFRRYSNETMEKMDKADEIWFGENNKATPSRKSFLAEVKDGVTPVTIWPYEEAGHNHEANSDLKELIGEGYFDNPKPSRLIRRILELSTKNDSGEIILDFFGGSGTTAQAVMELNESDGGNRKYILVQLPEKTDKSEYPTIAHITRERARRVIQKIEKIRNESNKQGELLDSRLHGNDESDGTNKAPSALGFRALRLDTSNFRLWDSHKAENTQQLSEQLELHTLNINAKRTEQDILFEIILKAGLSLGAYINVENFSGQKAWHVNDGDQKLLVCLASPIAQETLDAMRIAKPKRIVCLDSAFAGNDAMKTNTVLQMRDVKIDFRTV